MDDEDQDGFGPPGGASGPGGTQATRTALRQRVGGLPARAALGAVILGTGVACLVFAVVGPYSGNSQATLRVTTDATATGIALPGPTSAPTAPASSTGSASPTASSSVAGRDRTNTGRAATSTTTVVQAPAATEDDAGEQGSTSSSTTTKAQPRTTLTKIGVIRNKVTGMCVDVPNYGSVENSTPVTQYYCRSGSSDNQMYEKISLANGNFVLRNVKSGLCVDVDGSGAVKAGANVYLRACLFGKQDNQMFRKKAQGSGFYLVNVKSGLCLDVSNENGDNDQPDQQLTLYTCSPDDDHIWSFG